MGLVSGQCLFKTLWCERVSERLLVSRQFVMALRNNKSSRINEQQSLYGFFFGKPCINQRINHQITNAGGGRARPQEHDFQVLERDSRDSGRGVHPRQGHRCSALNIIVETQARVAESIEQRNGIGCRKIFELNEAVRIATGDGCNQFVN